VRVCKPRNLHRRERDVQLAARQNLAAVYGQRHVIEATRRRPRRALRVIAELARKAPARLLLYLELARREGPARFMRGQPRLQRLQGELTELSQSIFVSPRFVLVLLFESSRLGFFACSCLRICSRKIMVCLCGKTTAWRDINNRQSGKM
jgi:hypothetical protein